MSSRYPWEDNAPPSLEEIFALGDYRAFLKHAVDAPPQAEAQAEPQAEAAPSPELEAASASPEAAPAAEMGMAAPDPRAALIKALAGMVSHDLRLQLAYLFYAETASGIGRGELAELFREHAEQEVADAAYFMRRIAVLQPGGVLIPPPPSPEPVTDTAAMLDVLIEAEERGIAYLQSLHGMVGEDPMRFTIEQMLSDEQTHLDRLVQFRGAPAPAEPATALPETTQDAPAEGEPPAAAAPPEEAEAEPKAEPTKQADESTESQAMLAASNEPIEKYLLRTNAATMQQQAAELAHARQELAATREQATTASMQAEQAEATTQQLQQSLEQAQMSAQEAQASATQAVEQATMAEESAAQQAVAKMNLSMRIQQMRQMLADMASSDPVAEEGLGFGAQAGPGTPATATQQQMAAEQAAMMDPAAGGAPGAPAGASGDPAAEQQGEAVRAQQEAQKQTAQAQSASGGGGEGHGTSVTVKTSPAKTAGAVSTVGHGLENAAWLAVPGITAYGAAKRHLSKGKKKDEEKTAGLGDAARRMASTAGHDAGYGAVQGVGRALREAAAKHKDKIMTGAALGGSVLGVNKLMKDSREERKTRALERLAGGRD